MPRWKQRFVCLACAHSAWREVETELFEPKPDPARLAACGLCTYCRARRCHVTQVELLPKWSDAFKIEGMLGGLMDFERSAQRDVEIRQAIQKRERLKR